MQSGCSERGTNRIGNAYQTAHSTMAAAAMNLREFLTQAVQE
jgi:hypothetical protein